MANTNVAIKRIFNDLKTVQSPEFQKENGIYVVFDEDDIFSSVKALIIGKSETPYIGGYYFFNIKFPPNYPFAPPDVKYVTNDGNTRFNPNLYVNGKVCLSIINTWTGPSWTSCQTLATVLLSISAMVMIDNPLINEPGYNGYPKTHPTMMSYQEYIEYKNIQFAFAQMATKPIAGFDVFNDVILEHFSKNLPDVLKFVMSKQNMAPTKRSLIYGITGTIDYPALRTELYSIYNEFVKTNRIPANPEIDTIYNTFPVWGKPESAVKKDTSAKKETIVKKKLFDTETSDKKKVIKKTTVSPPDLPPMTPEIVTLVKNVDQEPNTVSSAQTVPVQPIENTVNNNPVTENNAEDTKKVSGQPKDKASGFVEGTIATGVDNKLYVSVKSSRKMKQSDGSVKTIDVYRWKLMKQ